MNENSPTLKMVLIGDSGAGKSSVAKRYADGTFFEHQVPTIGLDYVLKRRTQPDGSTLRIQLWDTAGQERFRSIASGYYGSGQVQILVYDCSQPHNLRYWLEQCERHNPSALRFVFANQRDRVEGMVPGKAWCEARQLPFFPMSAKTGAGVEEAFEAILRQAAPAPALSDSVVLEAPSGGSSSSLAGRLGGCC